MREREKKRESDPDKQLELDIVAHRGETKRRDGVRHTIIQHNRTRSNLQWLADVVCGCSYPMY